MRRWAGRALLVAPALAILITDLLRRHGKLGYLTRGEMGVYAASAVISMVLWGALLAMATQRTGPARWVSRVVLLALAIFAIGTQVYTFDHFQAYLNHRAVLVGTSMMPSIGQQLWSDRMGFAHAIVPPLLAAIALPIAGLLIAPLRRARTRRAIDIAVIALVLSLFVSPHPAGEQGETPDVLYLSAMGQLARARWDHNECVERVHPGPRTPIPVPRMTAKPALRRDVLFVITESVRAMSTCVGYEKDCVWTPFSNAAAPNRLAFRQMRALDSTTAISLSIMWSGLLPTESREALHTAPLLWEYMQAAGIDGGYWTSQNLLFGNSGMWMDGLPMKSRTSATELEPDAPLETGADDGKLVTHALDELSRMREPFLGVVHMSNTHYPYKIDSEFAPFQPESGASGPGYEKEIKNRYQDAIYLQDIAVGRLMKELRARPEGARTVVVFVSDHGEQMREKGAVGHTGTLFDPEIRIPFWIDAPPGTLTAAEEAQLRALENTPLMSLDVLPTLLDLLGLWDEGAMKPFRARMAGKSLLRGGSSLEEARVLTNCTELWACAFKNWGAMRGTKKLIAHQGDNAWHCYDVATDPDELQDLGAPGCGDLQALAEGTMKGRPF